ncbi:hypothetical protein [Sulfuracidifex tepidarius]|uniref:Uncharacterized protein n=1 Tax=Sulfuracidifex tepidarius TaxID=1294262 RepID=A0A510E4M3_9CREN|nr:hypothetical protein [Sulfuracidifex tepidarius]BBG24619.1 hypothetical protein IC006_1948 [Sulfuracidifex tepidarius]BBG27407.1 hypothetical protein IC007_1956 [Sulfuracidifex tepidarius]
MSSTQQKEQLSVFTVIKCRTCDYNNTRAFMEGDFVLKEVGKCEKDGGTLYIAGIYAVSQGKDNK